MSRRGFLKNSVFALGALSLRRTAAACANRPKLSKQTPSSTVYRSTKGSPQKNIAKVLDLMGGVSKLFGPEDIVVLKPNVQWWNHGVPNLQAIESLVDFVFRRQGGFKGEVVLIENIHRGPKPWEHGGWAHCFVRNAEIPGVDNYHQLCTQLKSRYGERFSVCHLVNVKDGGRRIYSPSDGTGYIYCDGTGGVPLISFNNGAQGERYREVIMTYPVFQSDSGTIVDFRYGIWSDNEYNQRPWKFINIAGINHHSTWCGISSAIKNYLGISDLSGGPDPHEDGKLINGYYNFHSFPFDKWAPGPQPGMIGAEIGIFLENIRKADLNIVTAEWIGLADRLEPPVVQTRAVLASTDPVALDFHSAKYLLHANSCIPFHDPENPESPTHQYIKACAEQGGGEFDESRVQLVSYDHSAKRLQTDEEAAVIAQKEWGRHGRTIGKYLLMRYGAFLL